MYLAGFSHCELSTSISLPSCLFRLKTMKLRSGCSRSSCSCMVTGCSTVPTSPTCRWVWSALSEGAGLLIYYLVVSWSSFCDVHKDYFCGVCVGLKVIHDYIWHPLLFGQVRLYQLSRLVHDFLPRLDLQLRQYDVTPFFYSASWFLTIFSSQYPIAFASRVLGLPPPLLSVYLSVCLSVCPSVCLSVCFIPPLCFAMQTFAFMKAQKLSSRYVLHRKSNNSSHTCVSTLL